MSLQFACIHCDQRLSASERRIGTSIVCPKCKREIVVPDAREAAAILERRQTARQQQQDENPFAQFAVYDDEELVYEEEVAREYTALEAAELPFDPHRVAIPRAAIYIQGILLGVVALASFIFGVYVGQATAPPSVDVAQVGPCQIQGAVFVQTPTGQPAPDVDAVAILLPKARRPDEKPTIAGLRPNDPPPDAGHPSVDAIRQIGGDYARADAQGRFDLRSSSGGDYYVLLVSQSRRRASNDPLKATDIARLGGYFQFAPDLIGDQQYQLLEQRLRGDAKLSHVFE